MIPRIRKSNNWFSDWGIKYEVEGKYGSDMAATLGTAIRYWLWHCGVPAKIAFWGVKKKE